MVVFSVLWNLPRFAELHTSAGPCFSLDPSNTTTARLPPRVCPTDLRVNLLYAGGFVLIANFLVMVLAPFIILITLNTKLIRIIKVGTSKIQ